MRKLLQRLSQMVISLQIAVSGIIPASAATQKSTKGMGNFFEKIYDAIFGESLDSFFEKHREEIQLRVKTGIIVFLLVLVVCALLITYFLITKKHEIPEDDEDDDEEEDEANLPDDLDELEDD